MQPELTVFQTAWGQAATVLLRKRYGIELVRRGGALEMDAWYEVLGTPDPVFIRGSLTVMAAEATGWCGLVAALIAPTLRARYYLGFSIFLIVYGVIGDWFVARGINDPVIRCVISLRTLLTELKDLQASDQKSDDLLSTRKTDLTGGPP